MYYYLLNEVSIVSLNNNLIEISSETSNKEYNLRIGAIASNLTGNKVKVLSVGAEHDGNIKSQMIKDFRNSSLWQKLDENFPGCEILDMIHKNG